MGFYSGQNRISLGSEMEFIDLVPSANMRICHSLVGPQYSVMVAASCNNRITIRWIVDSRQATFDSVITGKHRGDVWIVRNCKQACISYWSLCLASYSSYMESYGFRTDSCSNVPCYLHCYGPFITTNYQEASKLTSATKSLVSILNYPIKFIAFPVVFVGQSSSVSFRQLRQLRGFQ